MSKRKPDKSGWKNEAEAEAIQNAAEYTRIQEGKRTYDEAYSETKKLLAESHSPDQIRAKLVRTFKPCEPLADGTMPLTYKQLNASCEMKISIWNEAIEDALAGKQSNFKLG